MNFNFYEMSLLTEDYELLPPKVITLDDYVSSLLHSHFSLAQEVLPGGRINRIKELITHTYDEFKKAAVTMVGRNFGYTKSMYMPHPPLGFEELSDEGKRSVIYERALGEVRGLVMELEWLASPHYTLEISMFKRQPLQLPPEFYKWIQYMSDEKDHDDEIKGWEERSDKEMNDYEAKRQAQYKRQGEIAQAFGKELYRQRKKIEKINPSWAGMTAKEAEKTAADYMKSDAHERGQYIPIIRQIAKQVMGKAGSSKSYYMDDKETNIYMKSTEGQSVKNLNDDQLVDVVNKTVGITNAQDIWGMDWGQVHPGLSAGVLGSAAGLRMQAANELKNRLIQNKEDTQRIHRIYSSLDAENRRFFFRV